MNRLTKRDQCGTKLDKFHYFCFQIKFIEDFGQKDSFLFRKRSRNEMNKINYIFEISQKKLFCNERNRKWNSLEKKMQGQKFFSPAKSETLMDHHRRGEKVRESMLERFFTKFDCRVIEFLFSVAK